MNEWLIVENEEKPNSLLLENYIKTIQLTNMNIWTDKDIHL